MTACCYAARSKEASDNADRGPQRRRSRAQLRCHSSSLFDGGGREREMVGGGWGGGMISERRHKAKCRTNHQAAGKGRWWESKITY